MCTRMGECVCRVREGGACVSVCVGGWVRERERVRVLECVSPCVCMHIYIYICLQNYCSHQL